MGTGYKGNSDHFRTIAENLSPLKKEYEYENGYFGSKGNSNTNRVRHIETDNPKLTARKFYDTATYGGIEKPIYSKQGEEIGMTTKLADGSIVTWREVSSSDGSPAVDINIKKSVDSGGIKQQKIHFVKGD